MPVRLDAEREWARYAAHVEACERCKSVQGFKASEHDDYLCGEGRELLNVARVHTLFEIRREAR
jgi:hypothetical protein